MYVTKYKGRDKVNLNGVGRGIGCILGTLYHLGPPDERPEYEKYAAKQRRKDAIYNKRMESLYGDTWDKIKAARRSDSMKEMFSIK